MLKRTLIALYFAALITGGAMLGASLAGCSESQYATAQNRVALLRESADAAAVVYQQAQTDWQLAIDPAAKIDRQANMSRAAQSLGMIQRMLALAEAELATLKPLVVVPTTQPAK